MSNKSTDKETNEATILPRGGILSCRNNCGGPIANENR